MIKFLYDETIGDYRPFYSLSGIKKLLDLNWLCGEKELADFCDEFLDSLPAGDRARYSSEIRNILNKKLRMSREILAAQKLNVDLNNLLVKEIGEPCWVLIGCLDHGADAVIVNKKNKILKYMELKSTKAALITAKRKNSRGDNFGDLTAKYSSTFKFHLNKTDDHAKNYLNLVRNLKKDNVCVFLYTMCFEKGVNGIVDGFFLTGRNCAKILNQIKGTTSLRQISPSSCYGKFKSEMSFYYTKDLNKDKK